MSLKYVLNAKGTHLGIYLFLFEIKVMEIGDTCKLEKGRASISKNIVEVFMVEMKTVTVTI